MSEIVAERIKQQRQKLGLSQDELAKKLGVERSTVSKWESGKTNLKSGMITKLAATLECSPTWIAGLDEYRKRLTEIYQNKPVSAYDIIDCGHIEREMEKMSFNQLERLKRYAEYLQIILKESDNEDRKD